jgi:hypothetical protein
VLRSRGFVRDNTRNHTTDLNVFINSKLKCKVVNGLARETVCAAIEKSAAFNDV